MSDHYFSDDPFDEADFKGLDAIEAAHFSPGKGQSMSVQDNSFEDDLSFEVDEAELRQLDFIEDTFKRNPPSKTVQTTLFGEVIRAQPSGSKSTASVQEHSRPKPLNKIRAPKAWDHSTYDERGFKGVSGKGKEKEKPVEDEEDLEFEQFPARVSVKPPCPPPPMRQTPDLLEAKHWIFPINCPKREYQYHISKACLYANTIVALPTGLGKTFIAGVVMLNFYRWFPEGKIIFIAPTKPLVAQQISACHEISGIPGTDAAEITGEMLRKHRKDIWDEKRVFYCTVQALNNDLRDEILDARDVVLLVVDEAHRATGNHAYCQAVRCLMDRNADFRILALTATPGSKPSDVQELVNELHISHIEIRDENSLDLRPYIHHKKIEQHLVVMTGDIIKIRDRLAAVMDGYFNSLRGSGLLYGNLNPVTFHPYSAISKLKSAGKHFHSLSMVGKLARCMGYLLEGTAGMCYSSLDRLRTTGDIETENVSKRDKIAAEKIRQNPKFLDLMNEIEVQRAQGFGVHPKMEKMRTLIIDHFARNLGDDGETSAPTRAMVFVSFRQAVEEVVEMLNQNQPLIRAAKFVGQATDAKGIKGLKQKEQLELIEKFKRDEFNVLVATSIGEEGLDIGEVDLILCYDAQKTPIRMLQRLGRTGRKRDGTVHVLLAEGREEMNLEKAKDAYKHVQKAIVNGDDIELYTDVKRLIPGHIKPSCIERHMDIVPYVRQSRRSSKAKSTGSMPKRGTKRKHSADVHRNIPLGASTTFVSAGYLLPKPSKRQKMVKVLTEEEFVKAGTDDEVDRALEMGIAGLSRRAFSSSAAIKGKAKPQLNRSVTTATSKPKKLKQKEHFNVPNTIVEIDDEPDNPLVRPPRRPRSFTASVAAADIISLTSDDETVMPHHGTILDTESSRRKLSPSPVPGDNRQRREDMSWLLGHRGSSSPTTFIAVRRPLESQWDASILSNESPVNGASDSMDVDTNCDVDAALSPMGAPAPTFAPCLVRRSNSRSVIIPSSSPLVEISAQPHRRLRRVLEPGPSIHYAKKAKRPLVASKSNPLLDVAAEHSGDEVSEGSSGSDIEPENESDRQFLQEPPETQVSPSYDQTAAYRASLLTQAPGAPKFANRPVHPGPFGRTGAGVSHRRCLVVSSSPQSKVDDHYELDTFVVDDEAEISFLGSSDL